MRVSVLALQNKDISPPHPTYYTTQSAPINSTEAPQKMHGLTKRNICIRLRYTH